MLTRLRALWSRPPVAALPVAHHTASVHKGIVDGLLDGALACEEWPPMAALNPAAFADLVQSLGPQARQNQAALGVLRLHFACGTVLVHCDESMAAQAGALLDRRGRVVRTMLVSR